uniref:Uncharacterized protein n=1 Tax=Pelodiscus sinensis TaxID=13735 RepID=K7F993_PELSI
EELLRPPRGPDGHTEYLIRWSILSLEEGPGSSTNASSAESKAESILMWMSAEEVYANCPTLLGKRKPEGQRVKEEKAPSAFPPDVELDEASLLEMKADVRNLVQRAGRQMAGPTGPESSVLNTIHVLSAYASIGSLTGVFKETGALDLLMRMLCNEEKQIRRSAGKMLRALASHDAGERPLQIPGKLLFSLVKRYLCVTSLVDKLSSSPELGGERPDGAAPGTHHGHVQIPGKLLFSLVKRYLCVTSLVDKLSSSPELGGERPDGAAPGTHVGERSRVQREFEFSMAMANLISELVRVMGWPQPEAGAAGPVASPRKKQGAGFLTLSDFSNRNSYVEYVQESLKPGMTVRMLEDYEEVSAGDEGEFRQSNNGMPPVQVLWQSTGRTYWVHWHMVEIIGSGEQPEEAAGQEKVSSLAESLKLSTVWVFHHWPWDLPQGGLYSLPYLTERGCEEGGALSRAEWWELLFFVKKLEPPEQREIVRLVQQHQEEQVGEE